MLDPFVWSALSIALVGVIAILAAVLVAIVLVVGYTVIAATLLGLSRAEAQRRGVSGE